VLWVGLWVENLSRQWHHDTKIHVQIHFHEKPILRPSVSRHRLLEMTTVTLKNEASAIQEYSFA